MTFEEMLYRLKDGQATRARRTAWPEGAVIYIKFSEIGDETIYPVLIKITMETYKNRLCESREMYTPTQCDLFSNDWEIS